MIRKSKLPLNRLILALASLIGLTLVYVFQRVNYFELVFSPSSAEFEFGFNRIVRLIVNDSFCMLFIFAVFKEKKFLKMGYFVFLFELFVLLPIYLYVKLKIEGASEISSPLLSQIHRLIVNPMLMGILILGFYYQRNWYQRNG